MRRLDHVSCIFYLVAAMILSSGCASADQGTSRSAHFVAWVESVAAPGLKFRPLDMLVPGTRIELRPGHTMVVGYFSSCLIETVASGRITIGERESIIEGGQVARRTVRCRAPSPSAPGWRQGTIGGAPVRGGDPLVPPEPVIVQGHYPAFHVPKGASNLSIRRLTAREPLWSFALDPADTVVDFYTLKAELPLGDYVARADTHEVAFKVEDSSEVQPGPYLSRLVWIGD